MRDNHQGYPELLDTYERDGLYFAVVSITVSDETAVFEFGIEQKGYNSLKRIFQSVPFDSLSRKARYFFTGSFSKKELNSDSVTFGVRIEQGEQGKAFDFDGPASLVSNLRWFMSIKDLRQASALKRVAQGGFDARDGG